MSFSVSITITGKKDLLDKLRRFEFDLNDWSDELTGIGDELIDLFGRKSFSTSGGAIGESWNNLRPGYELWKAKHYPGRGILQRTGELQKGFRKKVSPKQLEIVNVVGYAKFHQFGTSKMAARKLVVANPFIRNRIAKGFAKGLAKKLKAYL